MTTYAIGIEYDGTHYHGWQMQDNVRSIQESMIKAVSSVANHSVEVRSAGRTDAAVHATGQVAHFVTTAKRRDDAWIMGINTHLPNDIRVTWIKAVSDDFNSRFSATARRYQYLIYNRDVKPGLFHHYVTWHYRKLDILRMQTAANYLVGLHDFNAYRAVECHSKTSIRNVHHIKITSHGDIICVDIQANAFLHHMVRNIVGVLMEVGDGRREPNWAEEVLHSKDRRQGGITSLPNGLYLVQVLYPDEFSLDFALNPPLIIR